MDAHLNSCLEETQPEVTPSAPGRLDPASSLAKLMKSLNFPDAAPADWVNVCLLDEPELNKRYTMTREELLSIGEMLNPATQRGRDLHSERAAYLIEMKRRGMK